MGIVVVGNVFVDIKGFPYDRYIPDGRNAGWVETVHGGVGRNVAEDIANAGLPCSFVSMVDDSPEGEAVEKKLRLHGVDTSFIVKTPNGMGIWLAVFDNSGDIAGSISKRPEMAPLIELIEKKGDEIFSKADSIVLEIDGDERVSELVAHYAKKYNVKLISLVANIQKTMQRPDLIASSDCFICNKLEAGILFGRNYDELMPDEMSVELAKAVASAGISSMIVTMGPLGAVYADKNGNRGCCPAIEVPVVDTTGAGDAYCAGVAVGLNYGKSIAEAMHIGAMFASSVITVSESVCPGFTPEQLGISI